MKLNTLMFCLLTCMLAATGYAQPGCSTDDFEDGNFDGWTLTGVGHANQFEAVVIDDAGNKELALTSDGATAYYGADNAGFLYKELTGDFRIETAIDTTTMTTGKVWRKAGLMARASLDNYDIRLLAMLAPIQQRLQFVAREVYGGPGNVKLAQELTGAPLTAHLAIERTGQTLSVQYSLDGITWITPDNNNNHGSLEIAALPATLYVGLAMVSNNISVTSTALFDDVAVCQAPPPIYSYTWQDLGNNGTRPMTGVIEISAEAYARGQIVDADILSGDLFLHFQMPYEWGRVQVCTSQSSDLRGVNIAIDPATGSLSGTFGCSSASTHLRFFSEAATGEWTWGRNAGDFSGRGLIVPAE